MAFTKEFILITLFMYFMFVRSEISINVTDNGFNHVSLLEYGDFLNDKQLMFKVKGKHDANVKLVSQTYSYLIIIGGWGNHKSIIRKESDKGDTKTLVNHKENGILNAFVYRNFWMSWLNGLIQVGKGNIVDQGIFMEIEDQCFYDLKDIKLFTSWESTIMWLIQPPAQRVPKNEQPGVAMFQEIRNCPSTQQLNTFTTSSAIECGLLCLTTRDCKMFRVVVKNKGECELLSEETSNKTFPSVYRIRD